MQKITQQQSVLKKNLRIGDAGQNIHRERERHKDYLLLRVQQLQNNQPLQKVTKSLYIVIDLGQLPFMLFT